ncbi:hypothetical protein D3C71_1294780 [compost metagenome]
MAQAVEGTVEGGVGATDRLEHVRAVQIHAQHVATVKVAVDGLQILLILDDVVRDVVRQENGAVPVQGDVGLGSAQEIIGGCRV